MLNEKDRVNMIELRSLCVVLAEGQSGGRGGQWLMSREAAGQTVSRPLRTGLKYFSACPERNRWTADWKVSFYVFPPHRLVSALTLLSKKLNCYKVTLECSDKNVAFYQKFGYNSSNETYMQFRFFDWRPRRLLTSPFSRGDDGPHTPSQPQLDCLKQAGSCPGPSLSFLDCTD